MAPMELSTVLKAGKEPGTGAEQSSTSRPRRTRKATAVAAAVLIVGGGAALGVNLTQGQSPVGGVATVAAGPFAGTWQLQDYAITIGPNGHGTARWRTRVNCGTGIGHGPTPCDPVVKPGSPLPAGTTHGSAFASYGGHASIYITNVQGNSARGVVRQSNELSILPNGPIQFGLEPHDLLSVSLPHPMLGTPFGNSPFCGPTALAVPVAQATAQGFNCG